MANLLPIRVQKDYFPLYLLMLRINQLLETGHLAAFDREDPVIEAALEAFNPRSPHYETQVARIWYYVDGYLRLPPAERPAFAPDALVQSAPDDQFRKIHAHMDARRPFWRTHISEALWMEARQRFVANGITLLDPHSDSFVQSPLLRELVYIRIRETFNRNEFDLRQTRTRRQG